MKRKNVQILSVYNVEPSELTASLKTIQGLRFREPKVNENNFCEVEVINATSQQWRAIMRLY